MEKSTESHTVPIEDLRIELQHSELRAIFVHDRLKPYREGYEKAEKFDRDHKETALKGKLPSVQPSASDTKLPTIGRRAVLSGSKSLSHLSKSKSSSFKRLSTTRETQQSPLDGTAKTQRKKRSKKKRKLGKLRKSRPLDKDELYQNFDTLKSLSIRDRCTAVRTGKIDYLHEAESTLDRPTRTWFGYAIGFPGYQSKASRKPNEKGKHNDTFVGTVTDTSIKSSGSLTVKTLSVGRLRGSHHNGVFAILQGYGLEGSNIAHYCAGLLPYLVQDAWKRLQDPKSQKLLKRSGNASYVFGASAESKQENLRQNTMAAAVRGATRAMHHAIINSPYAGSRTSGVTTAFVFKIKDLLAVANVGANRVIMGRSRTYRHISHGDVSGEDIQEAFKDFPKVPFKIANALWFPNETSKLGIDIPEDCAANPERFDRIMEFTAEGARKEKRSREELWISHFDNVTAVPLTVDQVPDRPDEQKRLESWTGNKGGGGLYVQRLPGGKCPYRHVHVVKESSKPNQTSEATEETDDVETGDSTDQMPFLGTMSRLLGCEPAQRLGLIAEPEVSLFTVCPSDAFMIIGSESIWRMMSSQEAVDVVSACTKEISFGGSMEAIFFRGNRVETRSNLENSEVLTPEDRSYTAYVGGAGISGQYMSGSGGGVVESNREDVDDVVDKAIDFEELKVRHSQLRTMARVCALELLKEADKRSTPEYLPRDAQFAAVVVLFDHRPKAYFKRTQSSIA